MFQLFPTGRTSRGAEQQSTGCEGRIIVSYSPSREPSPGMNDVTDLTAGSPAVVMLMRGCGGDITDPALSGLLSNYPAVFTDNYIICPVARTSTSEEADTERQIYH